MTSTYGQETLKTYLTQKDTSFYTRPAKTPGATYRVLFYKLSGFRRSCKVDVLVPEGDMNIPNVPSQHIVTLSGLPVMPLIPQLLLKLQAWSDHRVATRSDLQAKQYVDIRDVDALLAIAVRMGARAEDASWLPQLHFTKARERLSRYTWIASPETGSQWKKLGFSW